MTITQQEGTVVGTGDFVVVDLSGHFNNDGIAHAPPVPDGDLNGEGMAFPREVLPPSKQIVELCRIPFLFPDKDSGAHNNICLEGQVVEAPPGRYRALYVLGVSEGGSFEESIELYYVDGTTAEVILGLTNCRPMWGKVMHGEQAALRFEEMHFPPGDIHTCNAGDICGMWMQTIPVSKHQELSAIELGDNESMHVFALTLRRAIDGTSSDTPFAEERRL